MKSYRFRSSFIALLFLFSTALLAIDKNCIEIKNLTVINSGNINLGFIPNTRSYAQMLDDYVVKFEINCDSRRKIQIIKLENSSNKRINFETEWKCGKYTGFEQPFDNGIFMPENDKFYVTVRLKSIDFIKFKSSGLQQLQVTLHVAYCDM